MNVNNLPSRKGPRAGVGGGREGYRGRRSGGRHRQAGLCRCDRGLPLNALSRVPGLARGQQGGCRRDGRSLCLPGSERSAGLTPPPREAPPCEATRTHPPTAGGRLRDMRQHALMCSRPQEELAPHAAASPRACAGHQPRCHPPPRPAVLPESLSRRGRGCSFWSGCRAWSPPSGHRWPLGESGTAVSPRGSTLSRSQAVL